MLKATAGTILPTTITGSLPRPSWYTENLGIKSFLDAMVLSRFREQYVDALSVYLREQEVAAGYRHRRRLPVRPGHRRAELDELSAAPHGGLRRAAPEAGDGGGGGIAFPRGHILHDYLEARVMPKIVGPVKRGEMQCARSSRRRSGGRRSR